MYINVYVNVVPSLEVIKDLQTRDGFDALPIPLEKEYRCHTHNLGLARSIVYSGIVDCVSDMLLLYSDYFEDKGVSLFVEGYEVMESVILHTRRISPDNKIYEFRIETMNLDYTLTVDMDNLYEGIKNSWKYLDGELEV
jgi:hypothetical protein